MEQTKATIDTDTKTDWGNTIIAILSAVSEDVYTAACELGGLNLGSTPVYNVGNETACQHGYNHGWIHECLTLGGGAWCKTWHNGGPVIAAITGPGHCVGKTCESGNFIPAR